MSLKLHDLHPAKGTTKNPKRVGRGPGSGTGVTAGRGTKGQQSRSGHRRQFGHEGGQMSVIRRIPKRGFTNIFKSKYTVVNLRDFARLKGSEVTLALLIEQGIVSPSHGVNPLKVLGVGELKGKLIVKAHAFSAGAKEKIEKAGGRAEVLALA